MIQIIGSIFAGRDKAGDFGWMIEQPEYADALFVFNDNDEQFLAHRKNPKGGIGCDVGGGNAVIRPYQCENPPRAVGIPTGSRGEGYPSLMPHVKQTIEDAIAAIQKLVATGKYQRVFYSAANATGVLWTGIFDVGIDVKQYIVAQLLTVK